MSEVSSLTYVARHRTCRRQHVTQQKRHPEGIGVQREHSDWSPSLESAYATTSSSTRALSAAIPALPLTQYSQRGLVNS